MLPNTVNLLERFQQRDERALARAISLLEAGDSQAQSLLQRLRQQQQQPARIIGITGSPGSGKSTLTDRIIAIARAQQRRVAVIAVDPTSPFSGGAILGDRIRMTRWHQDPDVYIRSMATRGHLGGLAAASLQICVLLEAYGFDDIIIETVGVGQSEVDIVQVADSTVLVLTPGQGDGVQAFKAGIMEIADVFAINKFDHPGGQRLKREIQAALDLGHGRQEHWYPPIQGTIATTDEGCAELYQHIAEHHASLQQAGLLETRRHARARFEVSALLSGHLRRQLEQRGSSFIDEILRGAITPSEAVKALLQSL